MRLPVLLRVIPLLAAACAVGSCQHHALAPMPPDLSFTRYQPIYLDVENIDIIEEYKSPMKPPNIEHLMPISPAEGMRTWIKDRLRAVGNDKTLEVIIKDAGVISTPLAKPTGITGMVTDSQDRRYDAKLSVEMRIYGTDAMSEASLDVSVNRSVTIAESASLYEREAIYRKLVADLLDSANGELEKNMFMYFGNYISYSQSP